MRRYTVLVWAAYESDARTQIARFAPSHAIVRIVVDDTVPTWGTPRYLVTLDAPRGAAQAPPRF